MADAFAAAGIGEAQRTVIQQYVEYMITQAGGEAQANFAVQRADAERLLQQLAERQGQIQAVLMNVNQEKDRIKTEMEKANLEFAAIQKMVADGTQKSVEMQAAI